MDQDMAGPLPDTAMVLPEHRALFYGGAWHDAAQGRTFEVFSPGSGVSLGRVPDAADEDVDAAVAAARQAFPGWRDTAPAARAQCLRAAAQIVREHAQALALLDALDCGNAFQALLGDAAIAAAQLDFFAGLVTEIKGDTIPMGADRLNYSLREPLGVVARIAAFNHPFMFAAGKMAAPLAAGNTVVIKPPEQAPLSALRLAELLQDVFPPGVLNVVCGSGKDTGRRLVRHPDVAKVGLIGSVAAGKAVMRDAADTLKPLLLELGGKNALIARPDSDPQAVACAVVAGMNFAWCGQSCGSTSRVFLHDDIHDEVLRLLPAQLARFRPGKPESPATAMGAIVDERQHARILAFIKQGQEQGAQLIYGGNVPTEPALAGGFYIEPTVFTGVTPAMALAREEIFGPVLSILRWHDEASLLRDVNGLDLGLTCSIWTRDLSAALRLAHAVEAGYVWVNEVGRHFLGAPYGGFKQSGTGREECLEELLAFTQSKNVHVRFDRTGGSAAGQGGVEE
ncbi:aldehyde dehydrogenase family protein [Kerstersia gyiorum]|nr:aldehyde dehydrogenase family protein [Kerstersia gyiorum]